MEGDEFLFLRQQTRLLAVGMGLKIVSVANEHTKQAQEGARGTKQGYSKQGTC